MDKEYALHTHTHTHTHIHIHANGILLGYTKMKFAICSNLDGLGGHYAQ